MEEVKKLYSALINKGYSTEDLGDEATFVEMMDDTKNRKDLYDYVSTRGDFRIGDYDQYESRLASNMQPQQEDDTLGIQPLVAEFSSIPRPLTEEALVKPNESVTPTLANLSNDQYSQVIGEEKKKLEGLKEQLGETTFGRIFKGAMFGLLGKAVKTYFEPAEKTALRQQIKATEDKIQLLENQQARNNDFDNIVGDVQRFYRHMGQTIADYDFGHGLVEDAVSLAKLSNRAESGELTEQETSALLDMYELQELRKQVDLGKAAEYGEMAGTSATFMGEFIATAGGGFGLMPMAKSMTTSAARAALKRMGKEVAEEATETMIEKELIGTATKTMLDKGLVRTIAQGEGKKLLQEQGVKGIADATARKMLGETADLMLVKAPLMTATVGAPKVVEATVRTKLGDVELQEDGQLRFANDKSWSEAAYEGALDNYIEYASEMVGSMGADFSDVAKILAPNKIVQVALKTPEKLQIIALKTSQLLGKMGMQNLPAEGFEEYVGQGMRTIAGLESAYTQDEQGNVINNFLSPEFHEDLWKGLAFSMGTTAMVTSGATGIVTIKQKRALDKADRTAGINIGDEWDAIRHHIDASTNDNVDDVVRVYLSREDLTEGQKDNIKTYATKLMMYRGGNMYRVAQSRSGQPLSKHEQYGNQYNEGYNASEASVADIYATERLRRQELIDAVGEQRASEIFARAERGDYITDPTEVVDPQESLLIDLYNRAQAQRKGKDDWYKAQMEDSMEDSFRRIDQQTDADGLVRPATTNTGETLYIISGNVQRNEDGTVDKNASDQSIGVWNPSKNKTEIVDISDFKQVEEAIIADQLKQESAKATRAFYEQKKQTDIAPNAETDAKVAEKMKLQDEVETLREVDAATDLNVGDELDLQDGSHAMITEVNEDGVVLHIQQPNGRTIATPLTYQQLAESVISHNGVRLEHEETAEVPSNTEQIPTNEKGEPKYTQVSPEVAWDAILEQTEGDAEMAQQVVDEEVKAQEKKLQELEKKPAKSGSNLSERIVFAKQRKAEIEAVRAEVEAWKKIAGEQKRRAEVANEVAPVAEEVKEEVVAPEVATSVEEGVDEQVAQVPQTSNQEKAYQLSEEIDENGRQFVLTTNGELAFGEIGEDVGLPSAPILLSEGMITNPSTNDGYGLAHIEARHGEQIRKAGYKSVLDFIEKVAKEFDVIREGNMRDGKRTYRLQLVDKHNNTLMVELSGDGTYWNINTAGIFKTSYGAKNKIVYIRHTTDKQPTEVTEASQTNEQSGTTSVPSMDTPTQGIPSAGKVTESSSVEQKEEGKNSQSTESSAEGNSLRSSEKQLRSAEEIEEERRKPLRDLLQKMVKMVGIPVTVLESIDEVKSETARDEIREAEAKHGRVRAWVNQKTGEVFVYMPHLKSERDVFEAYIHEVIVHKGLKKLLGEKGYEALCNQVFNKVMNAKARTHFLQYPGVDGKTEKAADEFIAYISEREDTQSNDLWTKFVDLCRKAMVKAFSKLAKKDDVLSKKLADFLGNQIDADVLASLIRESYRELKKNNYSAQVQSEEQGVAEEIEGSDVLGSEPQKELDKNAGGGVNISPIKGYTYDEVIESISNDIQNVLSEAGIDGVEIVEVWPHGSRMRGDAKEDSDLDVVLFYKGDYKEDALFNAIGEAGLEIGSVKVDVNPIHIQSQKDIERYKKKSAQYDAEVATASQPTGQEGSKTAADGTKGNTRAKNERKSDSVGKQEKSKKGDRRSRRLGDYYDQEFEEGLASGHTIERVQSKTKGSINDFLYKGKEKPALTGIHHNDGFAVATDGHVMMARKDLYDSSLEGKTIDKNSNPITMELDGKVVDIKYPNWKQVIPQSVEPSGIDIDDLASVVEGIRAVDKSKFKENAYATYISIKFEYGKIASFNLRDVQRVLRGAKLIGATEMKMFINLNGAAFLKAESENGLVLTIGGKGVSPRADSFYDAYTKDATSKAGTADYNIADEALMAERGSEAFELATELTIDALKAAGVEVVEATDAMVEEVLGLAEMHKQKKAPETVSVQDEHLQTVVSSADKRKSPETALLEDESSFKGTAISSDYGAKILKDLDSIIKKYENKEQDTKTFLGDIASSLGIDAKDKSSKYATFEARNGTVFTIRISNHNATVSNFDNLGEENGISIVVSRKPNTGIVNDGDAHLVEFFYSDKKLKSAEGKPLVEILKSIKQSLYSGEFKDNTGIAQVEEVNIPEFMQVYHGSGAKFDKFDHSFMGSGEGAQAFGWGTYVTEVEGIGRTYAGNGGQTVMTYKGSGLDTEGFLNPWRIIKDLYDENHGRLRDMRSRAERILGMVEDDNIEMKQLWQSVVDTLKQVRAGELKVKPSRLLYTVEIPDDNGTNYLHHDKDVPKHVKNAVKEKLYASLTADDAYKGAERELRKELDDLFALDMVGGTLYGSVAVYLGSDKETSEFLNRIGFVGIKYPTSTLSGGNKDGKSNYVIFNEADAQITDRVEFLRTADGVVYGWAVGGKVYLTKEGMNPNTPAHEYTHLWAQMVEQNDPTLWGRIVDGLRGCATWNDVLNDKAYEGIWGDENRMASEVLSRLTGAENYRREMARAQREIEEAKDIFDKAEKISTWERVKTALRDFLDKVKTLLKGERRKEKGETVRDVESDVPAWMQFVDMALGDLYGGVNPGNRGGSVELMFIGEQGAAAMDKAEEASIRLDNLAVAREMEAQGKDALAIKMATGWERGADDKWRYEISDYADMFQGKKAIADDAGYQHYKSLNRRVQFYGLNGLSERERKEYEALKPIYNNGQMVYSGTLQNVLKHDELFKAYPELKDYKVVFKMLEPGVMGSYNNKTKTITISEMADREQAVSFIFHEVQHAIQDIEGFATGGNSEMDDPNKVKYREISIAEIERDIQEAIRNGRNYQDQRKKAEEAFGEERVAELNKKIAKEMDALRYFYELKAEAENRDVSLGNEGYWKLAGEVEARNVQERLGMTPEERWNKLALTTEMEDVARKDQIFIYDAVESLMGYQGVLNAPISPLEMSAEEKAQRGEMLRSAPAIDVSSNVITRTEEMSARKVAEMWWDNNVKGSQLYSTEIGEVEINKNSVESSLAHRYSQKKLDAITSLVDGFNNAVYLGTLPDGNRQEGVQNHYFAYPINYGGERNYVFCRAMQDANKNRLYVHEVFVADKIKEGDTLQTAASQPHGGISLYRDILANVLSYGKGTNSFETGQNNSEENEDSYYAEEDSFSVLQSPVSSCSSMMQEADKQTWSRVGDLLRQSGAMEEGMSFEDALKSVSGNAKVAELELKAREEADGAQGLENKAKVWDAFNKKKQAARLFWNWVGEHGGGRATFESAEDIADRVMRTEVEEAMSFSRVFGGNSGYVGYSMSKRAAQAREEGRFPKTDFKKEYGLTEKVLDGLVKAGIVDNSEWHHTSKYGNKTPFYGWVDEAYADVYAENKNAVKQILEGKNVDGNVFAELTTDNPYTEMNVPIPEGWWPFVNNLDSSLTEAEREYALLERFGDAYTQMKEASENNRKFHEFEANKGKAGREFYGKVGERLKEFFEENKPQKSQYEDLSFSVAGGLDEVNERFNEELDRFSYENADNIIFDLGFPSEKLRSAGVVDKAMKLYGSKVARKMKKHRFSSSELRDLPKAISDPIAVFNNYNEDGNRSILTELKTAQGNVLVTLSIGKGQDIDFNIVSSVFGKGENNVVNWLNKGFATYINKEKALNYLHLATPIVAASNNQELNSATKVVESFENPQINEVEFSSDELNFSVIRTKPVRIPRGQRPNLPPIRQQYDAAVKRIDWKGALRGEKQNWKYNFLEAYQDSMLALKRLQEIVTNATGKPLMSHEDAYTAENQMSSKNHAMAMEFERMYYRPINKALAELMKKGGIEYQAVADYLRAKHGLERNAYMAKDKATKDWERVMKGQHMLMGGGLTLDQFKQQPQNQQLLADMIAKNRKRDYSGLTSLFGLKHTQNEKAEAEAQKLVAEFEAKHDVKDLWDAINSATKATLKMEYESGLISRDTYHKVLSMYQNYIPLRGWEDNEAKDEYEYLNSDRPLLPPKKIHAYGRTSISEDPIAMIGLMGVEAIRKGNRNRMKQKFLNMAMNHPTELMVVNQQWYVKDAAGVWHPKFPVFPANASADDIATILEQHEADMQVLAQQGLASYRTNKMAIDYHSTKREQQEHVVNVSVGNKDYAIYLCCNPRAAQAVNGLTNPESIDSSIIKTIRKGQNLFARLLTSLNPEFIVSNGFRDQEWALASVTAKEPSDYVERYVQNNAIVLKKIWSLVKKFNNGTLDKNVPLEKSFYDFIMNGGETGYTEIFTADDFKERLEKQIKEYSGDSKSLLRVVGEKVEFLNRSVEDVTRFAVFLTSRQMGRDMQRSVDDAKNITVNFNKKGAGGLGATFLTTFYVFANATIQSNANLVRLFSHHKKKMIALVGSLGVLGMVTPILNSLLNSLFTGDDDDEDYWDITDWTRRNNIIICSPWSDKFIKIPLSHELRPFYAIGEITASILAGKTSVSDGLKDMALGFAALSPIDFTANDGNFAVNVTPTMGQPVAQVIANTNYFGNPIYNDSDYMENYPEWQKAYKGTNSYLVEGQKGLNELFGGNNIKAAKYVNAIGFNPAVQEHLLESYLGGLGRVGIKSLNTISMLWDKDARQIRNVPILSAFSGESNARGGARRLVNDFYSQAIEEVKEFDRLRLGYEKELQKGNLEYEELLKELYEGDNYGRYLMMKVYVDNISELNSFFKEETNEDVQQLLEANINLLKMELYNTFHSEE